MTVKNTSLERISRRIQALFGLHFAESRHHDLARILINTAAELHLSNQIEDIASWVHQDTLPENELSVLIKHLTVTETYFFREKPALALFRQRIIPAIIARRNKEGIHNPVRIWSAGCSSGEEPYTIAMLLRESIPDIDSLNISILATDINDGALKKATAGTYTPWSFRETTEDIKKKYFKPEGKLFEIDDSIKRMVSFSKLNLATGAIPAADNDAPPFDVIFCRNVLMYMSPETIINIAGKFHNALISGGWLITSQVELNDVYFAPFQRVLFGDGIFYHKASSEEIQTLPTKVSLLPSPSSGNTVLNKQILHTKLRSSHMPAGNSIKSKTPAAKPTVSKTLKDDRKDNASPNNTIPSRSDDASKISTFYQTVEKLFDAAQYNECASACHEYIAKNGPNKDYLLLLSRSYANMGQLEDAGVWMRKLLEKESTDAQNYYFYGSILIEQGLWDEAGRNLTKALYLQPDHPAAQLSISQVFKRQGKYPQAQRQLNNLIRDIEKYDDDTMIPLLEGITAGRLREMASMLEGGLS